MIDLEYHSHTQHTHSVQRSEPNSVKVWADGMKVTERLAARTAFMS